MDSARPIEQSIRQRCFAVIDMRDDAEIPGQLDRHKALHYAGGATVGQSGLLMLLIMFLLLIMSLLLIMLL